MQHSSVSGPSITWLPVAKAPPPPTYLRSTISGGLPPDYPITDEGAEPRVPVIEYGGYQFWCFQYQDQRNAICMVAYDARARIMGVKCLEGIKDVSCIQNDAFNRTLIFIEPGHNEDYRKSWFDLYVHVWAGKSPVREDNQLLDMLPRSPFSLSCDHGKLVCEGGALNLVVIPDEVTRPDLWMLDAGALIHENSKLALAVVGAQLVCEPVDKFSPEQQWQLTATGELFNVGGQCVVSYDDNLEFPLCMRPTYEVSDRHKATWKLVIPKLASSGVDELRRSSGKMPVHKLEVVARLADDYWSGTSDVILLALGYPHQTAVLFDSPQRGATVSKELDFRELLDKQQVAITDLSEINIYQVGRSIYGGGWKLESLELVVNGYLRYSVFRNVNRWFGDIGARRELIISWPVYAWLWRNDDNHPLDYNGQTYSVGMLPYIIDLLRWRNYDPSTIDGVGQLMGVHDGRLVGENLKTRRTEWLEPNGSTNSYTWVYTPDGAIIYKLWEHRVSPDTYVRHSQLAKGRPVICAGELRIVRHRKFTEVEEIIGLINDASGHYKPDGGACLVPVLQKLQHLGIPTQATRLSWRARE
ncbi:MAG TPA: hypothetical protein VF682_26695 [Pseudomonas sp.]|jgi:hypothetical protein